MRKIFLRSVVLSDGGGFLSDEQVQRRCDAHEKNLRILCPQIAKLTSYRLIPEIGPEKENLVANFVLVETAQADFWIDAKDPRVQEDEVQQLIKSLKETVSEINRIAITSSGDLEERLPPDEKDLRTLMKKHQGKTTAYETAYGQIEFDFPATEHTVTDKAYPVRFRVKNVARDSATILQPRFDATWIDVIMPKTKHYRLSFPADYDNRLIAHALLDAALNGETMRLPLRIRFDRLTKNLDSFQIQAPKADNATPPTIDLKD